MGRADRRARSSGPHAQLKAQVRAYVRFALSSPLIYSLLFGLQPQTAATGTRMKDFAVWPAYEVLLEAVIRCRTAGIRLLLDDDAQMTVLVFVIAHGRVALSHAVPAGFITPREILQFVENAVDEIIGESPRATSTSPSASASAS
jgi:hypothetical protein